jgi:DNA polymerase-3 subunit beta
MKVSIKRENLSKSLSVVGRMVKQRASLPVLSNIMLMTDRGRLKLVATDLEAACSEWIGAKIDEEGAITVPARTLVDYVTTTTDDTLELVSEGADLNIKGARHHATIKGISAEEFPIIPQVKSGSLIKIRAQELKTAIFSVVVAAALDETRPVLAGVLFRVVGSDLLLVATDSYRLAEKRIAIFEPGVALDVVIPARTLSEVARILPADDSMIEISNGENQVQFRFGETEFLTRQIDGAFPDYEQIIPKEFVLEADLSKNEFQEAIKMASVFARDAGGNIKVAASESGIVVSAISSQIGDAENHVKASTKGTALTVAFNAKYILDALNVMNSDEMIFALSGQLNPGMIFDKNDGSFRYIVMPLRND